MRSKKRTEMETAMRLAACLGMAISLLLLPASAKADDDALRLALRGAKAYEDAQYASAVGFFERATRIARLKGQDEYAAQATANLVDIWLEIGQPEKAAMALNALGPPPPSQAALLAWKKAQVALAQGRLTDSKTWLDSAANLKPDAKVRDRLEFDRLRYRKAVGDTAGFAAMLKTRLHQAPSVLKPGYAALAAEIALSHQGYPEADKLFGEALEGYRKNKRYARLSLLLARQAACASALGERERALLLLRESLVLASEMGLDPGEIEQTLASFGAFAKRPHERDFEAREDTHPTAHESLDSPGGPALP